MVKKLKTSIIIILLFVVMLSSFICPVESEAKSSNLNIRKGTELRYNFTYYGSFNFVFASVDTFTLTVENITDNTITFTYEDDLLYRRTRVINANETLWNLPLGRNTSYVTLPSLADIICPAAAITTDNWLDNIIFWASNQEPYYTVGRYAIHDLAEKYAGTWREAHIFNGSVSQTHFGFDIYGTFNVTYSDQSGVLLGMNADLSIGYSGQSIRFSAVLIDSTKSIGLSPLLSGVIILSTTFGLQWLYSIILVGIVYYRNRPQIEYYEEEVEVKTEPDKDEIEKILEPVEKKPKAEPIIKPKDLPEDYNFIYKCPFCNAEMREKDLVCPECGGKR